MRLNHYSQKGLAAYIGISERAMSAKLNGRCQFTLAEMRKVQSAFPNCTLDYLFTWYAPKD
jgi:DNA-binding XRE family transcriptional regulator